MSITLTAYPAAFLISPDKSNEEKIQIRGLKNTNLSSGKRLISIKVLTNLTPTEAEASMKNFYSAKKTTPNSYILNNGLNIKCVNDGNFCSIILSGINDSDKLQKNSEDFFQKLDSINTRATREIRSRETFYYAYETDYIDARDIKNILINQGAKEIYINTDENTVTANLYGDNIKYLKKDGKFTLEVEKRISIVNINTDGNYTETVHRQSAFKTLQIQTNINSSELTYLLQMSGYRYMRANGQTPLKTPYSTLNWVLENGKYTAVFSGTNQKALAAEIEQIFEKLNSFAGRDLRFTAGKSESVYTYNTNYTDKEILINTLKEHGAVNLTEGDESVSCRIFDSDMVYKRGENGAFVLEITRVSDIKECENLMRDLNEEYGLNIQEMTYKKIKERLANENMRLEDETVLEDNSIVLTIDIG